LILAPCGGITRIRFKGAPVPPLRDQTLSHAAPPHLFLGQDKTRVCEVNTRDRESRG